MTTPASTPSRPTRATCAALRRHLLRRRVGFAHPGASWNLRGDGMVAAYMPPELAGQKETQDPHRVARCAAAPDTMWMQHHCGIFRSTDAAAPGRRSNCRWTTSASRSPRIRATRSPPGSCPPSKTSCACRATARSPCTRTGDGGKTWQSFRAGLPQKDAYDLIYRHGLDVDGEGSRLAMGSTTGSLWVSEDAGEAWQLLNAHLPPVYAVRLY